MNNAEKKYPALVSIIVPVYNRENLIKIAINTVLNQSYTDWEMIIIDDSSSDNTKEVVTHFSNSDSRIKLIDNKFAKGPSGTRNTGLDIASGDYIAYLDSDDEWMPFHLERMIACFERHPEIDVMSADPLRKNRSTGEVVSYDKLNLSNIDHRSFEDCSIIDYGDLFDHQLRGRVITTQCIVGKSDILKSVRWNESLGNAVDNLYNLEVCAKRINVGHIEDYHAIYWIHDDNLSNVSGSHSPQRMEKLHLGFIKYWQIVANKFNLSNMQKRYVNSNLATTYAWHLGYHTYEPQKKYREAINCYLKAIKYTPYNFKNYFALIKAFVKLVIRR